MAPIDLNARPTTRTADNFFRPRCPLSLPLLVRSALELGRDLVDVRDPFGAVRVRLDPAPVPPEDDVLGRVLIIRPLDAAFN